MGNVDDWLLLFVVLRAYLFLKFLSEGLHCMCGGCRQRLCLMLSQSELAKEGQRKLVQKN